jgi:hypothetical protein
MGCNCNKPNGSNFRKPDGSNYDRIQTKLRAMNTDLTYTLKANGIGDALCALLALGGIRKKHADRKIIFHLRSDNHKWVSLFQPCYDYLFPMGSEKAIDLNRGYNVECTSKALIPRFARYCINAGNVQPVAPILKDRDRLKEQQSQYRDVIALCPFSVYNNRCVPTETMLALETLLIDAGYNPLILHDKPIDERYKSIRALNKTPEEVTGILLNASAVIGVDSGLAHLSAMIQERIKTIVLTGPTKASKVFFNPVIEVTSKAGIGGKNCSGCFWQFPYSGACDSQGCAVLKNIDAQDIMKAVYEVMPLLSQG